mmetsp:Transcript_12659/g.20277  ORF Transcript_12659/g.20277 Transcript_12659/m.20277 type:complete len:375 (+) Transcript_12659:47-1171(+)
MSKKKEKALIKWARDLGANIAENAKSVNKLAINSSQGKLDVPSLNPFTNLKELYMQENNIGRLPSLSALKNLEYIYVPNNELVEVPDVSGLSNLLLFDLSRNKIEEIDIKKFEGATSLVNLDISFNKLRKFPSLAHIKKLMRVELDDNELEEVDFKGMRNLRIVSMKNNRLKKLPDMTHLIKIQQLIASNNELTEPPIWKAGCFKALKAVDLAGNDIHPDEEADFLEKVARNASQSSPKPVSGGTRSAATEAPKQKMITLPTTTSPGEAVGADEAERKKLIAELEGKVRDLVDDNKRVRYVVNREILALQDQMTAINENIQKERNKQRRKLRGFRNKKSLKGGFCTSCATNNRPPRRLRKGSRAKQESGGCIIA